jgi:hypothetical protein
VRPPTRSAALLAAAALLVVAGSLLPAAAAEAPVEGTTVAFRSQPYADPVAARPVSGTTYWLAGSSGSGGTWTTTRPTGATSSVQSPQPIRNDGSYPDAGAAWWQGPHRGRVSGPLRLTLHWTGLNPLATFFEGDNAIVSVVADPGTPEQALLGEERTRVTLDEPGQPVVVDVHVDGTVREALLVQVVMTTTDGGSGNTVAYGSADAPSSVVVPSAVTPRRPAVSTTPLGGRPPLRLAALPLDAQAAEPTVGVHPDGSAYVAAAAPGGPASTLRTSVLRSSDGGRSWGDVTPRVAGQPFPPLTQDPYVHVDPVTGRVFTLDLLVACSVLQWSDDGGATWATSNPLACAGPVDDHPTLVTGPPPPGVTTSGYPRVVYYCANKVVGAACARSLDGGRVFAPSGQPAFEGASAGASGPDGEPIAGGFCGGLTGHAVVDAQGRLYLPKGHCGRPWLAVSDDGGATWEEVLVAPVPVAGGQTSVAVDEAGTVYYAFWDAVAKLPHLAVSRDGGRTFGTPLLVAPPGLAAANFPTVDAGAPGVVAIAFPGTDDLDETRFARPWDHWVLVSDDADAPRPVWRAATANPPTDPTHRGACLNRCGTMLDFLDVEVDQRGGVWATLVDTCTGDCVRIPDDAPSLSAAGGSGDRKGVVVRVLDEDGSPPTVDRPGGTAARPLPATGGVPAALLGVALLGLALLMTARPRGA